MRLTEQEIKAAKKAVQEWRKTGDINFEAWLDYYQSNEFTVEITPNNEGLIVGCSEPPKENPHTMDLKFLMQTAYELGEKGHPQKVMSKLGIAYKDFIPQSIGDQWWFLGCENVPKELPPYLKKLPLL